MRLWLPPLLAGVLALVLWQTGFDRPLFLTFNHLSAVTGPALWAWITVLGDALTVLTFSLLLVGRRPDLLWAMVPTWIIGSVAVQGFKELFETPRPPAVFAPETINIVGDALRSFAFPSGHSATAVAFAAIFFLHPAARSWIAVPLAIGAVLVAISRMAVAAHWPVDVLGGAVIGWCSAVAGLALCRRFPGGQGIATQRTLAVVLCIAAGWLMVHDTGYPQALMLQRMIAVGCLLFALPGLWRVASGATRK